MRLVAQQVLRDCEVASALLESEEDRDLWRVHWVGAIALLRAVGHVLHKVDSVQNEELRPIIHARFAAWKSDAVEHTIFREFIDQERNNVLKEYASTAHDGGLLPILIEHFPFGTGAAAREKFETMEWLSDDLYRPRIRGFRSGDDVRDIYRDAINWWRHELTIIAGA